MATDAPNELDVTEADIPRLASRAGRLAYQKALAAGKSVVIARGGTVLRVYPDGRQEVLKRIAPPVAAVRGAIFRIPSSPRHP